MIRFGWVFVLTVMLTACSPDYNWRQMQVGDGTVTAFFPDRPRTERRSLEFEGHQLDFSLTSASVGNALFTVGHAGLGSRLGQDEEARGQLYAATLNSLYRNLGAQPPKVLPPAGQPFVMQGQGAAQHIRLKAIVWIGTSALVEGLVTAPADSFPEDQADEFLRGIQIP